MTTSRLVLPTYVLLLSSSLAIGQVVTATPDTVTAQPVEDSSVRNDANAVAASGLQGGLVVQLGSSDVATATELSKTGRYLFHVLDTNAKNISAAQKEIHKHGHYGLSWAEQTKNPNRLPYAENVVNLIIIHIQISPSFLN